MGVRVGEGEGGVRREGRVRVRVAAPRPSRGGDRRASGSQ